MRPLNTIGFETPHGFRTVELVHGDIGAVEAPIDVLVVSAFAGSYIPSRGTLIAALYRRHGVDLRVLAQAPALNFRAALGTWVSSALGSDTGIGRILCVEMVGSGNDISESLGNAFATLLVLEAKGISTTTIAMPLLGAGSQGLNPDAVAGALIESGKRYLERSVSTLRLMFVELDAPRASAISQAMDRALGRTSVSLPHEQLVAALRTDVTARLQQASELFIPGADHLRGEWIRLLQQPDVRAAEFGVLGRKLVELVLTRHGQPQGMLANRIRSFESGGAVAPWICGYMNVLRHLGNEASHDNLMHDSRRPNSVAPQDLVAGLFCVMRLIDFWLAHPPVPSKPPG